MNSDIRKTPSYLRGLAESRARISADVLRLERLQADITEQLEKAKNELEACDTLIREFDSRLTPSRIEPIQAWKGRYGARGTLKAAVADYVKRAAPNEASTAEVACFIEDTFSIEFPTKDERERWRSNSIKSCLKQLMRENVIERLHEASIAANMGWWRWVSAPSTIEGVTETALQAGVALQHNTRRRGRPKATAAASVLAP